MTAFKIDETTGKYHSNPDGIDEQELLHFALKLIEAKFPEGEPLSSPDTVKQYLRIRFAQLEHEIFAVIWLDTRHRMLALEQLFTGTIAGAAVHPREVVKAALKINAAAAILVHNHPSGEASPSTADRDLTERLKTALALVEVRVLDHMVVGSKEVVSFAERGYI